VTRAPWLAIVACVALCGCGNPSDLTPIRLRHSPPIGQLSAQQLRSLSMECEQYPDHQWARGRFDAAYCEAAIAAWSDSPLQLVVVPETPAETAQKHDPSAQR
jgi:hypothetical protein